MKRLILLPAILLVTIVTASAQTKLGVKGGISIASIGSDQGKLEDRSNRPGFSIGVINRNSLGSFSIQSELLFTRKSSKYKLGGTSVSVKLNYLELPVTLQVNLFGSPLSAYAGGYTSYLLNTRYRYSSNSFETTLRNHSQAENHNIDYGLLMGMTLNLGRLHLDGRFIKGYNNAMDDGRIIDVHPDVLGKTKNFGFILAGGFWF